MLRAARAALPVLLLTIFATFSVLPGAPQAEQPMLGTRPRSVFAPYFTVGHGYRATMTLNNSTRSAYTVYPTVYSLDGAGVPLQPVRLEAHEHKEVDLADWVTPLDEGYATGSLRLDYESVGFGLGAQVAIMNEHQNTEFAVPLRSRGEFKSPQLEGLWWSPDKNAG